MKLLLTSNGLANESIRAALRELVGHTDIRIAFVPTAANVEDGDKDWLIRDLVNARKMGTVDIVDISALDETQWLPRIEKANVLLFGGGNTFHLMRWLTQSGLAARLPELLKTRVYVGISAGSIVTNPSLSAHQLAETYYEGLKEDDLPALGFVTFSFRPHFNDAYFKGANETTFTRHAAELAEPLYALDDESAMKVVNSVITVVSEGTWKRFPN